MDAFTLKAIGLALVFIGVTDIALARTLFEKRLNKLQEQLTTTFEPKAREELERKVSGMTIASRVIMGTGFLFTLGGAFLLLR